MEGHALSVVRAGECYAGLDQRKSHLLFGRVFYGERLKKRLKPWFEGIRKRQETPHFDCRLGRLASLTVAAKVDRLPLRTLKKTTLPGLCVARADAQRATSMASLRVASATIHTRVS